MAISQTQINSASLSTVYSSTVNTAVTAIYICNTSSATIHFSLLVVPNSETPNITKHSIYYSVPITSTDTYVVDTERLIFSTGDTIHIVIPDYTSDNIITTVSYVSI
jgi:hypothetical protein